MILADTHLLGSISGYSTQAASEDITREELHALESLTFGDTSDDTYRASLEKWPAAMGRPLPSGRYAITRCFDGPMDDIDRKTLVFATAVVSMEDWQASLSQRLRAFLWHTEFWQSIREAGHAGLAIDIESLPISEVDPKTGLAVLDLWFSARRDPRCLVALPDTELGADAVLGLPRLLPTADRANLSWGLRVLNASAPVAVASLCAPTDSRRKFLRPSPGSPLKHNYAQVIATFWEMHGAIPSTFINGVPDIESVPAGPVVRLEQSRVESVVRSEPATSRAHLIALFVVVSLLAVGMIATTIWLTIPASAPMGPPNQGLPLPPQIQPSPTSPPAGSLDVERPSPTPSPSGKQAPFPVDESPPRGGTPSKQTKRAHDGGEPVRATRRASCEPWEAGDNP